MKEFLIGDKVKWKIGNFSLRGIYIEKISETESKVLCVEQNGMRRHTEIEVLTRLLENDDRD